MKIIYGFFYLIGFVLALPLALAALVFAIAELIAGMFKIAFLAPAKFLESKAKPEPEKPDGEKNYVGLGGNVKGISTTSQGKKKVN